MKKALMCLLCLCLLGAAPSGFARFKGRALKFAVPTYQGEPPQEYTYKSLGYVKGEYKGNMLDGAVSIMSKTLEKLASNAKEMGANAVIKVKYNTAGIKAAFYDGEAVVFDKMPDN